MKEHDKKRIYVTYFSSNGEFYYTEEEYAPGYYSKEEIIQYIIKNKIRYKGLDFVILDGNDDVRPFVQTFLYKADKILKGSRGFR